MNKQNFTLTVFVGDVDESLAQSAKMHHEDAFLIDYNNINDFIESTLCKDTTVYTALGDLPKDCRFFVDLCMSADQIFYSPPDYWSDGTTLSEFDPTRSVQGHTEHLLLLFSLHVPVYGLSIPLTHQPIELVDKRKTTQPQVWVAGCSISHGVGVNDNQRYGSILSDQMNVECSFLTRPGAAIDWASDQILRSDITSGDTVIFGITSCERLTYVHGGKLLKGITAITYDIHPSIGKIIPQHNLLTENTFFQHTAAIDRVINFCSKSNVTLILFGVLSHTSPNLFRFLNNKHNFFQFPYKFGADSDLCFEDLGSDALHPGPKQHESYAKFIKNNCLQAANR